METSSSLHKEDWYYFNINFLFSLFFIWEAETHREKKRDRENVLVPSANTREQVELDQIRSWECSLKHSGVTTASPHTHRGCRSCSQSMESSQALQYDICLNCLISINSANAQNIPQLIIKQIWKHLCGSGETASKSILFTVSSWW